jgi:hypothetical protein
MPINQLIIRQSVILSLVFLIFSIGLAFSGQHLVFDEIIHYYDIKRYFVEPIGLASLRQHVCANGILSHILPAYLAKLIATDHVYLLRSYNLFCVFAIVAIILRYSKKHLFFAFGLTAMICNPYSVICSASFMTEYPSLLLAVLGLIFIFIEKRLAIGYLFVGLACISRLYYIALLPALFLFNVTASYKSYNGLNVKDLFAKNKWLFVSILPILWLVWIWGGLTPPRLMEVMHEQSGVGINPARFLVALLYICFYVCPVFLLFEVNRQNFLIKPKQFIFILLSACITGYWVQNLFNLSNRNVKTGAVDRLIKEAMNLNVTIAYLFICIIILMGYYCLFIIGKKIKESYSTLHDIQKFALYFTFFYCFQNFFVVGNIPFYERYTLAAALFYGMVLVPSYVEAKAYKRYLALNYFIFVIAIAKCIPLFFI